MNLFTRIRVKFYDEIFHPVFIGLFTVVLLALDKRDQGRSRNLDCKNGLFSPIVGIVNRKEIPISFQRGRDYNKVMSNYFPKQFFFEWDFRVGFLRMGGEGYENYDAKVI